MAQKIIWTLEAKTQLKEILSFWIKSNGTNTYSKKLNSIIKHHVDLLSKYPNSGRLTDYNGVRLIIIKDYLLFYKIINNAINIVAIIDGRRNPDYFGSLFE